MISTPFRFEPELTLEEFAKLGQLSLRWSHTEHIIGNCLRVMLRLSDEEAVAVVFPMNLETRLQRMNDLAKITPLNATAQKAFDELMLMIRAIQYVRNSVIHAVVIPTEKDGHIFELRSKRRQLTKVEILSSEELTNYTGHVVLALRYALGDKDDLAGHVYTLPERPPIPEFLRSLIQEPKAQ